MVRILIRIRESMKHISHVPFSIRVVEPFSPSEFTRFDISLAFPSTQKNIATASLTHGPHRNVVMFVFITIISKFLPQVVPFKMRKNLIPHIL